MFVAIEMNKEQLAEIVIDGIEEIKKSKRWPEIVELLKGERTFVETWDFSLVESIVKIGMGSDGISGFNIHLKDGSIERITEHHDLVVNDCSLEQVRDGMMHKWHIWKGTV